VSRARGPRRLGEALERATERAAPETLLAAVQARWKQACGEAVAARAEPVAERGGVISVACDSATWAQELDLQQDRVRERLNEALGAERVLGLRFTADRPRHRPAGGRRDT